MDKQTLGARITSVRRDLKISQEKLAERLGFATTSRLGNYESGRSFPPVSELPKIAAALGLSVDELLSDGDAHPASRWVLPGNLPGHVALECLSAFAAQPSLPEIFLPEFLLRNRLPQADLSTVRWIINPTSQMSPRIPQGALVFVDTTQNTLEQVMDGETYVIRLWGRTDIRRIFIFGNNEFRLTGHNENERRLDLTRDDYRQLEIGGKVIDAI